MTTTTRDMTEEDRALIAKLILATITDDADAWHTTADDVRDWDNTARMLTQVIVKLAVDLHGHDGAIRRTENTLAGALHRKNETCKCDRCDRPLRDFIQVDGWANIEPGDCFMVPDSDGDVMMAPRVREPQRSGTTVRIHIAADAERADVLRLIRKQLAWIERELLDGTR